MLYALVPVRHELARKHSLSVSDLKKRVLGSGLHLKCLWGLHCQPLQTHRLRASVECGLQGFEMVAAMVASGGSVSVAPGLRLTRKLDGIRAIKLRPEARRKISVAYRIGEKEHPAVKVFVEELLRSAALLTPHSSTAGDSAKL